MTSLATMPRVHLDGEGWAVWRGVWSGSRALESRSGRWCLTEHGREFAAWPSFRDAVQDLWPVRGDRTQSPWAIGFVGYEACAEIGGQLPARPSSPDFPEAWWLIEPRRVDSIEVKGQTRVKGQGSLVSCCDDASFRAGVVAVRELIASGQVYQVNLTRRFQFVDHALALDDFSPVVDRGDPPEYLSRFEFEGGGLLCASMEMLCRKRGNMLETRPIKGTRRRGRDSEEDHRLKEDLSRDAKELAELAMIVDLERNDLGRVARSGTVRVLDPGRVITHPGLHHRVARIGAQAEAGMPWWKIFAAMVPGGSVTGCPKRAAMKVISTLEQTPRGPYTGALGVIAGNGDMELALPIRSAWHAAEVYHFAAGSGIVWESDPAAEERESRLKVAPWLALAERGEIAR